MTFVIPPSTQPTVEVMGTDDRYPVHRIYCVGRNYAAHAREMGMDPEREPPFFFSKPADAVVANGTPVPYPPRTANLHHEIELVIAIGTGGRDIPLANALAHVFGYAVGNDLTRRDLQFAAREQGRPWDVSKGFDASAPVSAIRPASEMGHPEGAAIWLEVNGQKRQSSDVAKLIWNVNETIEHLSKFYALAPGDLIFTGTPEGAGAVKPGDLMSGGIAGIGTLQVRVV